MTEEKCYIIWRGDARARDGSLARGAIRMSLDLRASLAEITQAQGFRSKWEYVKDHHFSATFPDVTVEDAEALASVLDMESRSGSCPKARVIRARLEKVLEYYTPSAILSHCRRVNCGCHETGSYSRYEDRR